MKIELMSQFTVKNQQQVQTPPSFPESESDGREAAAVKVLNERGKSERLKEERRERGGAEIPETRGLK